MRTTLTTYPVRRVSVPRARRVSGGARSGASYSEMSAKLNAASDRLARSRPRRID